MGLFGKKTVEKATVVDMLDLIDRDVNDMAREIVKSGDKKIQMIHMSGIETEGDDSGNGKGRCLAVIGNPQGLIDMLYSASIKEKNFARILFTAAHLLSSANENMAKLRTEVAIEVEGPCECPACVAEAKGELNFGGKSIKIDDLANMTEDQMNTFAKSIVKDSIDSSKQS